MATIANDGIEWRAPAPDESVPETVLLGKTPHGTTYAVDRARLGGGYTVFYSPFGNLPNIPLYAPLVATVEEAQAFALGHAVAAWDAATQPIEPIRNYN